MPFWGSSPPILSYEKGSSFVISRHNLEKKFAKYKHNLSEGVILNDMKTYVSGDKGI